MTDAPELDPEDAKLVTLARAARGRTGAPEGAAVRDETGRTYVGTTVDRPSLRISALRLAVAMAVSSGADALEAAALVTSPTGPDGSDSVRDDDLRAVADLAGEGAVVHLARPDGTPLGRRPIR